MIWLASESAALAAAPLRRGFEERQARRKMNKAEIVAAFKLSGLNLEAASRDLIAHHLSDVRPLRKRQEELNRIVEHISSNPECSLLKITFFDNEDADLFRLCAVSSAKVTADLIEAAIRLGQEPETTAVDDIAVFDHKSLPVAVYDPSRGAFVRKDATNRQFHSLDSPFNRIHAFRERFQIINQRVLNHPLFRKPAVLRADQSFRALTPISSLRRSEGECAVLGLLTQPREGIFCLEDCSHSIEVEMTKETETTIGLFTENCVVLAEGVMAGEKFRIDVLAMPPFEERSETCKRFPNLASMSEGEIPTSSEDKIDEKTSVIMLSDVWLDRPKVQTGLKQLFKRYNAICQEADEMNREHYIFVLMGNFTSQPAPVGYDLHRTLFDQVR